MAGTAGLSPLDLAGGCQARGPSDGRTSPFRRIGLDDGRAQRASVVISLVGYSVVDCDFVTEGQLPTDVAEGHERGWGLIPEQLVDNMKSRLQI